MTPAAQRCKKSDKQRIGKWYNSAGKLLWRIDVDQTEQTARSHRSMKRALYRAGYLSGLFRLFAGLNRNRPVVLAFHGVTTEPPGDNLLNYEGKHLYRPIFVRLMEYLGRNYRAVSLERIVDWLEGKGRLPQRAFAVTFDDGYRNVATNAAPVLTRLRIPATFFVVADFVRSGRMLWADELITALALTDKRELNLEADGVKKRYVLGNRRDIVCADRELRAFCKKLPETSRRELIAAVLEQLGVGPERLAKAWSDHQPLTTDEITRLRADDFQIGSHSCTHSIIARCEPERMKFELERSKEIIEEITKEPCTLFSYPNGAPGDFDQITRGYVVGAGYRCAVTTVKRRLERTIDPLEIPRYIATHNNVTVAEFDAEVSGFRTFARQGRRVLGRLAAAPASDRDGGSAKSTRGAS